jgi:hypothetical protein
MTVIGSAAIVAMVCASVSALAVMVRRIVDSRTKLEVARLAFEGVESQDHAAVATSLGELYAQWDGSHEKSAATQHILGAGPARLRLIDET